MLASLRLQDPVLQKKARAPRHGVAGQIERDAFAYPTRMRLIQATRASELLR
jgi:hypothetical protein